MTRTVNKNDKIYVAGHRGMVGSAIMRTLNKQGYKNLIGRSSRELDLCRQDAVEEFFAAEKPDRVFLAAARVGGIMANKTYPAQFIYINLAIQTNVIHAAWKNRVKSLLFLGSSCIYPRDCPQPIKEEYLLTSPLESTNEAYAVAKIAGLKLCQFYNEEYGTRYWSAMPTNLYGPNDNFDLEKSHVLPALIRKHHLAKLVQEGDIEGVEKDERRFGPIPEDIRAALGLSGPDKGAPPKVVLWGTGSPKREFLHVDDLAMALIHVMLQEKAAPGLINIGCGRDQTIAELTETVKRVVGFTGPTLWDSDKPDGTPQKLLDISKAMNLGWRPSIDLEEGLRSTYRWYLDETN